MGGPRAQEQSHPVSQATGSPVHRMERGLGDEADVLGVRLRQVERARARGRHRIRRRGRVDRDAVGVELGGEALGRAGSWPPSPCRTRRSPRSCRSRRTAGRRCARPPTDVIMSTHPCSRLAHRGERELREVQRREHVHLEHQARPLFSGTRRAGGGTSPPRCSRGCRATPTCSMTSAMSRSRSSLMRQVGLNRDGLAARGDDSSSVSRSDPTYFGSGSSVRAVSATVAPSAANRSAIALPSPRLPRSRARPFPHTVRA